MNSLELVFVWYLIFNIAGMVWRYKTDKQLVMLQNHLEAERKIYRANLEARDFTIDGLNLELKRRYNEIVELRNPKI